MQGFPDFSLRGLIVFKVLSLTKNFDLGCSQDIYKIKGSCTAQESMKNEFFSLSLSLYMHNVYVRIASLAGASCHVNM